MVCIVENDPKERMQMERIAFCLCITRERKALFVNAECLDRDVLQDIRSVKHPVIVYVAMPWDRLTDEKKAYVFSLCAKENVGMTPGYPFSLLEFGTIYRRLKEKKAVDNSSVAIIVRRGLVKQILASVRSLKSEEEKKNVMRGAEEKLGICISSKEARELLLDASKVNVASLVPSLLIERTVKGVFCDIEGSLFNFLGEIDKNILLKLRDFEKRRTPVTLWTDGDVYNARCACNYHGIKDIPVISKRHYAGRRVECVIDRLDSDEFRKKHRIFPEKYIRIN